MSKVLEYIDRNRKDLLNFIRQRGVLRDDAEDILSEACLEVLLYYKEELEGDAMTKPVFLALNSQISKYFGGRGTVAARLETVDAEDCGLTFEQLHEQGLINSEDPLATLIKEETALAYPALIDAHTENLKHRECLNYIYVEGVAPKLAGDMAGISRQARYHVVSRFTEALRV